jgi:hypothetical protein
LIAVIAESTVVASLQNKKMLAPIASAGLSLLQLRRVQRKAFLSSARGLRASVISPAV